MIRRISCLFVLLAAIVVTGCATGGYLGRNPYPGPLGQVMAGNLALTCPGDYFVGPPINRCLRSLGGDMGRYSNYPMYRGGMGGYQLSPTDKLSIFCGLGGSGLTALLNASFKKIIGAGLLSAASCEVAGALLNRKGNNKGGTYQVVTPPSYQPATVVPQLSPPLSVIPSCWHLAVRGQYSEWFDNSLGNTPTIFTIVNKFSGETTCFGIVRPGGKELGPAIWAHRSPTSDWEVTGKAYVTGVNSNRSASTVEDRTVQLDYVRNYGWYTRCPC